MRLALHFLDYNSSHIFLILSYHALTSSPIFRYVVQLSMQNKKLRHPKQSPQSHAHNKNLILRPSTSNDAKQLISHYNSDLSHPIQCGPQQVSIYEGVVEKNIYDYLMSCSIRYLEEHNLVAHWGISLQMSSFPLKKKELATEHQLCAVFPITQNNQSSKNQFLNVHGHT